MILSYFVSMVTQDDCKERFILKIIYKSHVKMKDLSLLRHFFLLYNSKSSSRISLIYVSSSTDSICEVLEEEDHSLKGNG